jgi:hypothetical protein
MNRTDSFIILHPSAFGPISSDSSLIAHRSRLIVACSALAMPDLELLLLPVDSLRPMPRNLRAIAACEAEELARSIRRFGLLEPVVVRARDRLLIAGRRRVEAAAAAGLRLVPAAAIECSDADALLISIALNKTGGVWDVAALCRLFREVPISDADLAAVGFTRQERDRLAGKNNPHSQRLRSITGIIGEQSK